MINFFKYLLAGIILGSFIGLVLSLVVYLGISFVRFEWVVVDWFSVRLLIAGLSVVFAVISLSALSKNI